MKNNFKLLVVIVLLAGTVSLFGCATNSTDNLAGGLVPLVTPEQRNSFTEISVLQAGEELVISGAVNRRVLGTAFANPGHVDVVVYDATGTILAQASHMVRFYAFTAKNQTQTLAPQARFSFRFPIRATRGTQVGLAFHKTTPFSWSTVFDCGDNRAADQVSRSN